MQEQDDATDSRIKPEDLSTLDSCRTLSFSDLEVLVDLLRKESDRIKKTLGYLVTSTDNDVLKALRPKKMLQAVKAVCALLGNIETLEVSECCDHLAQSCMEFHKARGNEDPSGRLRPEVVGELGEKYATVTLKGTPKQYQHYANDIATSLEKIETTIHNLIEIYAKTFRVNFSFKTPKETGEKMCAQTV